jgi:hypothetical protein
VHVCNKDVWLSSPWMNDRHSSNTTWRMTVFHAESELLVSRAGSNLQSDNNENQSIYECIYINDNSSTAVSSVDDDLN